jgi:carboxymethylenebutenolidase
MCFSEGSAPPVPPIAGAAVDSRRFEVASADGATFAAFAAMASEPSGAAMLVLPDVRGLTGYYEELALRFAEAGIDAVAIDYFGRTAGSGLRAPGFDHMAHVSRTAWPQLRADAAAAAASLRDQRQVTEVFSIGFCFGGRLSFALATAPELGLAGAIGFYGWPVGPGRAGVPAPAEVAGSMAAPVLAIFGGADEGIGLDAVATFERALASARVDHRVVTYPGAPHSFFDRRAEEFADASAAAWGEVLDFVRMHAG